MKFEKRYACTPCGGTYGQRSIRLAPKFPVNRKKQRGNSYMVDPRTPPCVSYGRHDFGPGQKVWVVLKDRLTGRLSVDWDIIEEIYAFGEVGSGALYQYWLQNYSIGHGAEYRYNLYANRNAATWAMNQCSVIRQHEFDITS